MIFMDSLPIKSNSACNEEQLRAYLADTRIPLRLGPMTRRRMTSDKPSPGHTVPRELRVRPYPVTADSRGGWFCVGPKALIR
jgi:hypothetical protein